jgi:NTE family protein
MKSAQCGLVLTGGGARGSYQAGALRAIYEIGAKIGRPQPFRIISGTSAGSINASYLAANVHQPEVAMQRLTEVWSNLRTDRVFRSDFTSLGKIAFQISSDLVFGGFKRHGKVRALLDASPLRQLLNSSINFHDIDQNLSKGLIDAVEITGTSYATSVCVSFVQSIKPVKHWTRLTRYSEPTKISIEHVMASTAIPLFFPPTKVGSMFFGDGSLRNSTPLSPAIRLGSKSLMVIGVKKEKNPDQDTEQLDLVVPSIGRVVSVVLNALFMDAVDQDLDRLKRINDTMRLIPKDQQDKTPFKPIEFLYIRPSRDLGLMAAESFDALPETMQYLIRGLGSKEEASELLSYLLFEKSYTSKLVSLGYEDTIAMRNKVEDFLMAHSEGPQGAMP